MSLTLTSRVDKNPQEPAIVWILVWEVGYGHAPILTTSPERQGALFL